MTENSVLSSYFIGIQLKEKVDPQKQPFLFKYIYVKS